MTDYIANFALKEIKIWKINITPLLVFLGIIIISTTIELVASYLLEMITGGWLWDYNSYSFNFQGRIALNPSVRFGLGGMLFMYVLQPLFEKLCNKLGDKKVNIISTLCCTIILVDLTCKIMTMI